MKDKLCGQIMRKNLRSKTYSYLKENNDEGKKTRSIKICVIKRELRFKDYKKCLKIFRILHIINCLERKGINVDSLNKDKKIHKKQANIKEAANI